MNTSQPVFQIKIKKITFKQAPTAEQSIMCNLLYNNKKIDNTDPFQVPANQKSVDLSSLKPLIFNFKQDENKLPIFVYILYAYVSAKKVILKRSDMIKKYDLQQKDTFQFDQDFGTFGISYQVVIKKEYVSKKQTPKRSQSPTQKITKQIAKNQQFMQRSFKRPQMLEVGEKTERIRKSSVDQRQMAESQIYMAESQINIQSENSQQKIPKTTPRQQTNSIVPPLTLIKDQKLEENLVKKDLKINLFQNFGSIAKKQADHDQKPNNNNDKLHGSNHNEKAHSTHGSHHGSHDDHQEPHKNNGEHNGHDGHEEPHDGHDSHGGHHDDHGDGHGEHSEPMSLKLKTVMAMLMIGFLFLMYDALDDRFSRKVRKPESVHGHGQHNEHGNGDDHELIKKKKKTGKKTKKVSTH